MNLLDAFGSIRRSYRTLLTLSNGPVASISTEPVTGSREQGRRPRNFGSEADALLGRVVALARITEEQVNDLMGLQRPIRSVTRSVILDEVGKNPAELAFLYGMHQSEVERIRYEAGKDRTTGEPRTEIPLAEPARETLRRRARERSGA